MDQPPRSLLLGWFPSSDIDSFPAEEPLRPAPLHALRATGLFLFFFNVLAICLWRFLDQQAREQLTLNLRNGTYEDDDDDEGVHEKGDGYENGGCLGSAAALDQMLEMGRFDNQDNATNHS